MVSLPFIELCILIGAGFLVASLVPVSRILKTTRSRMLRRAWLSLAIMISGFILGYMSLIGLLPRDMNRSIAGLVCGILAMGGIFVFAVASLASRTASDLVRLVQLERDIVVDSLTGVHNRRYFEEKFIRDIDFSRRTEIDLSLLLIDIDHFKEVNDTHGHSVGDEVLSAVAARLKDSIRFSDSLARFGGEEFAVVSPNTGTKAAIKLAERICENISKRKFACAATTNLSITVSIGCATMRFGESADNLLSRTDAALYMAKREGRNRVVFDHDLGMETTPTRNSA